MHPSKASLMLARAKALLPPDPLDDPAILALTERFLELHRQAFRDAVDTVIELGQILREVKPKLPGNYGRWLDHIGVSPATAHNYESLAKLSAKQPGIIEHWKELGPAKLYRVGDMSPEGRKAVLRFRAAASLQAMTDRQFAQVTSKYVVNSRKVTPDMRAHGLRMKLASWTTTLRIVSIDGIRSEAMLAGLCKDLDELARHARALKRMVRAGSRSHGGRSRSKSG